MDLRIGKRRFELNTNFLFKSKSSIKSIKYFEILKLYQIIQKFAFLYFHIFEYLIL